MPQPVVNPQLLPEVEALRTQVRKLLDELLGTTQEADWENARVRKVGVCCKVRPETRRRLDAIAKMHPGFEDCVGTLVGRLLDGFAQGFIPCPFCLHPYPMKVKRLKEEKE